MSCSFIGSNPGTSLLSVIIFPESSSDFPCFWWPWQFLEGFCRMSSQFGICLPFWWLDWRYWVLGERPQRLTAISSHHIKVNAINMIHHCWRWPCLPGWGSVCQVSFFPLLPRPCALWKDAAVDSTHRHQGTNAPSPWGLCRRIFISRNFVPKNIIFK